MITVRAATPEDAAPIAKAHTEGWQVGYAGIVPASYLEALDLTERTEHWRLILSGQMPVEGVPFPINLAVELDGAVVGSASVGRFRDQPTDPTKMELWSIYVAPDAWGSGAGTALMGETMAEFRQVNAASAYLWVLEGNPRARRFYERLGWVNDEVVQSITIDEVEIPELRYSIIV